MAFCYISRFPDRLQLGLQIDVVELQPSPAVLCTFSLPFTPSQQTRPSPSQALVLSSFSHLQVDLVQHSRLLCTLSSHLQLLASLNDLQPRTNPQASEPRAHGVRFRSRGCRGQQGEWAICALCGESTARLQTALQRSRDEVMAAPSPQRRLEVIIGGTSYRAVMSQLIC